MFNSRVVAGSSTIPTGTREQGGIGRTGTSLLDTPGAVAVKSLLACNAACRRKKRANPLPKLPAGPDRKQPMPRGGMAPDSMTLSPSMVGWVSFPAIRSK
jgi:hypothetical protein